jgi:hypothetical protein
MALVVLLGPLGAVQFDFDLFRRIATLAENLARLGLGILKGLESTRMGDCAFDWFQSGHDGFARLAYCQVPPPVG